MAGLTTIIRKVDASKDSIKHCLLWMQNEALPHDTPREIEGDHWWIAYADGNPVGFASLAIWPSDDADPRPIVYLSRAGVLPHARGGGLQKRLIRARVNYAKKLPARGVVTYTRDNPPSMNSLISEGFKTYHPSSPWAADDAVYWFKDI